MRISTRPSDPGYREDAGDGSWVVLLNGEPQSPRQSGRAIVAADEARGAIWFHPCAEDGAIMAWGDFGCPQVEMAEGKVSLYRISSDYLPRRG